MHLLIWMFPLQKAKNKWLTNYQAENQSWLDNIASDEEGEQLLGIDPDRETAEFKKS